MVYWSAYQKNKPVLAICRGIQLINVLHGGSLYQDLRKEREVTVTLEHHMNAPYDRTIHGIRIKKNTPLFNLLGKEVLQVNSYHHQGIRELGKNLNIMAEADDGLVEGVYVPNKKFIWAVQWHPEFIYQKDCDQNLIFSKLAQVCKNE